MRWLGLLAFIGICFFGCGVRPPLTQFIGSTTMQSTAEAIAMSVEFEISNTNDIPLQLIALMRTNINVQELTVAALLNENIENIFHAAMLDPHTAAELDLDQIWAMVSELIRVHGDWLPEWVQDAELGFLAGKDTRLATKEFH